MSHSNLPLNIHENNTSLLFFLIDQEATACGTLVSRVGIKPMPLAVKT